MTKRMFKDHTCKKNGCTKLAEKDKYGLYKTYCSDECNPRKHDRICENPECSKPQPRDKYGNYGAYCSPECSTISSRLKFKETYKHKDIDAITAKRVVTTQLKYGVDNVSQTQFVRDKLRITTAETADIRTQKTIENNLKNYGVESTNSLQWVKDKKKDTFLLRYGVDHQLKVPEIAASVSRKNTENAPERLKLARQTCLERYGVEHFTNLEKMKATCLERYGVENPSQCAEIHMKKLQTGVKTRLYAFPSGKIVGVQGYEPYAITELLKTYHEDDIITETTKIPVIPYDHTNSTHHKYFPDIYIPKDNLLIEVKSQYIYNGDIVNNILKHEASINAGYNHKFMIIEIKNKVAIATLF